MSSKDFVHLHVHTEYSLLDGINRVKTLPEYISGLGQRALAITDHGNVSGSYKFYKSCRQAEIKPIIGMEAYYTVNDRTVREVDDLDNSYYHLILIALNDTGLRNLFKLSSYSYTEGMYRKPRIDDYLIGQYSEGICATTACLGSRISQLILNNRKVEAEKLLDHHKSLFGDRFLIELQLHEEEEQRKVNSVLTEISLRKNIPIVITNDCHYTHSLDKQLHEAALCMQTKSVLSDEKRFTFGEIDVHVANHDWMWATANRLGLPYDGISNTVSLAEMVDDKSYFKDRINRYPKFLDLPEGLNSWDALERVTKQNLFTKFNGMPPDIYKERLNHELNIIKKMGFSDYMLIVWQFLDGARDEGVWVGPGRGSAAGSLVAYALDITKVDPIKYGLIFERFLNSGRSAIPKIFSEDMREQLDNPPPKVECQHSH